MTVGLEKARSIAISDYATELPETIIFAVVAWLNTLFETRLFHLWSNEQVKKQLVEKCQLSLTDLEIYGPSLNGSLLEELSNSENQLEYLSNQFPTSNPIVNQKIITFISNCKITIQYDKNILLESANLIKLDSSISNMPNMPSMFINSLGLTSIIKQNEQNLDNHVEFLKELEM